MTSNPSLSDRLNSADNNYTVYEPFTSGQIINSSIIIPVYNGSDAFEHCINSLGNNPAINCYPESFEIVVVDDGSNEDICGLLKGKRMPCKKTYVTHGRNKGRSMARNTGIKYASNELLFFFDADVIVPEDYFQESWKVHNALDKCLVVGLAENIALDEARKKCIEARPDIKKDFRYYKGFKPGKFDRDEYRLIEETQQFRNFGFGIKIGPWTLPMMAVTNNLSVRRTLAGLVGGFDERFKGWGYEDTHFGAKLIARGCYLIPLLTTGVFRINRDSSDIKKLKMRDFEENKLLYEALLNEQSHRLT